MTIQQLEYVLAVDTYRHFGRAAEFCRVTQPTLSMMIQKLEDELEIKLFDRSQQPIQPTKAGEKVIKQARNVIQQASLIKDIVKEEEESIEGVFKMGILPTIAPYLLPRFIQGVMKENPGLDLRVMEMKTETTLKSLLKGEIDAAIIASREDELRIESTTLFYEQFLVYISREEPIFKNKLIKSADISEERLWLLDEGHCFRDQLMRFCNMEKVKLHQAAYQLGSLETFMRMVEGGNGITFIPELAVEQFCDAQKELVHPFAIPRPAREIVFITRKDFVRHKVGKLLVDSVRASVPKHMLTVQPGIKVV